MTGVNGPRMTGSQERAQMTQQRKQRAAAREQAHKNFNQKVDAKKEQIDKAIDRAADRAKAKGDGPKAVKSLFEKAKPDGKTGNEGKNLGGLAGAADKVQRGVEKGVAGVVDIAEGGARGVYRGYKKAEGAVVDTRAWVTKKYNHAAAKAVKTAHNVKKGISNGIDYTKTKAKQVKNWCKHAWQNFKRLGD